MPQTPSVEAQATSLGRADAEVHEAVLRVAAPLPNLRWLDVGCGQGNLLRLIKSRHEPVQLTGIDLIDRLADDLRPHVELQIGGAEDRIRAAGPADRVLFVETLDDLDGPWSTLRHAASLVLPGGRVVVSVPNVSTLRSRVEILLRGYPSSLRPTDLAQQTPIYPHVVARVLQQEGLDVLPLQWANPEVVPFGRGARWPRALAQRWESWLSSSVIVIARKA